MKPEQVQRRAERKRKRKCRTEQQSNKKKRKSKFTAQAKDVATEHAKATPILKKLRPCCGRHQQNCSCQPPKRMKKMHLTALAKRFAETELFSVKDTTDVSAWQHHMQHATEQLHLRVLVAYAHTHEVFNQEPLLQAFIDCKAFLL
jgi:hypothetical protein